MAKESATLVRAVPEKSSATLDEDPGAPVQQLLIFPALPAFPSKEEEKKKEAMWAQHGGGFGNYFFLGMLVGSIPSQFSSLDLPPWPPSVRA